jgi:hypothetical protein
VEIGASIPGANTSEGPAPSRRLAPPWKPGQSGNPSGRPRVARTVSAAYAELLDTPGRTLKEQLENFHDKRGAKFCASDMVAVGMLTSAVNPSNRGQTSAASEITDRTEGKVSQGIDVSGSLDVGSAIAAAHARATGGQG